MTSKLRLGVVFGGQSVEHEVSVVSALEMLQAADPARFVTHRNSSEWSLGSSYSTN